LLDLGPPEDRLVFDAFPAFAVSLQRYC
jgi:hypothetical protein